MSTTSQITRICAVTLAVLISGMALDAMAKKSKIDGKAAYKANCKICHDKGSENGEYTPMTLIMDQWERFFDKKYVKEHENLKMPEEGVSEEDQKTVTEAISPEVLEAIKEFSIKGAADSEHPMTCG